MSNDAVIAVQEEKARIGNVEVTRKTALLATDEGIVIAHSETINQQPRLNRNYPALPAPRPVPSVQYDSHKGCCDYCCCECDSNYSWYELEGKGCFMLILLLLMYLVLGAICLPFLILYVILFCLCYPFCRNKDG